MKIAIGSDHGGFEMKANLINFYKEKGENLIDIGTCSTESCDYSDIASEMAKTILSGIVDFGILICGTGIGISIAANRFKGIRAAVVYNEEVARLVKEHNNANVLVFGGRTMNLDDVIRYIEIFRNAKFEGGRHERRIEKMDIIG